MGAFQTPAQPTALPAWEQLYYDGDRLRAEVSLLAAAVAGHVQPNELVAGCAQIHRSHGVATAHEPLSAFTAYQQCQPEPLTPEEAWKQLLPVADLPDALLFWAFFSTPTGLV